MDELDCEGLIQLLENGFPLSHSLQLLKSQRNRATIEAIEEKLSSGTPITAFFAECCPKSIRRNFLGFCTCLNFEQSLSLSIAVAQSEKKMVSEIRKTILYPFTLLLASISGLYLFNSYVLPPMLTLLSGFDTELDGFEELAAFTHILTFGLVTFAFLLLIILVFIRNDERQIKAYITLNRFFPDSVIALSYSIAFIRFYRQCILRKISTKETLLLFRTMEQPILVYMADAIENGLLKGERFETAMDHPFFDSSLGRFLKIAVYSGNMESLLGGYLDLSAGKLKRRLLRIARALQFTSYGLIGLMMIFIYRILLIPLSVMATI